ncbi:zinc finger BED domain-containing protein DAYSLEEPER [Citrus sinensis]|uniref:Zinc finger BED domain-containing protein DAYSLEEPER n=2 Tax=Citrus TaxID=2706 RepID=A0ACB8KIM0_CITSI|nr:zinc finger BED domain-containing protein DAYSLEEPER [Citrus sinensis]
MRKYRDADGNVKAECKHCKKMFDGSSKKGTTHLKNHLERCPANPKRKGAGGRYVDDRDISLSPSIKTKELASLIKGKSVRDLIRHLSNMEGDISAKIWGDRDPWVIKSRKGEILQLYQEEKEKLCQFLNNLSCRFSLQLVFGRYLVVNYIDDSWERQSKIISFCQRRRDHIENLIEDVKQSCLDWKIDTNVCSLLPREIDPADDWDNQIGKVETWFSQRRSLPFAGCLSDGFQIMGYIHGILHSEDYLRDGIQSLTECAQYVRNKSTSDKLLQLDGAVEAAISELEQGPLASGFFDYFGNAVGLKEVFLGLEQLDSDFRSINLSKQKWDEVTATFEHLKFLKRLTISFMWGTCDIPIIVDLPYVHKILKDRCNHPIEDCPFCEKVMKKAIDIFFTKYYLVRVIAVILDPRFKMDGLQLHYKEIYGSDADRYLEKMNKDFRDVYDEYAATDSSNSKSYEMLDAMGRPSSPKSELDRYFNVLKVPRDKQFDILAWWRSNAPSFPTLARMARDYLAIEKHFAPNAVELIDDIVYIDDNFDFDELPEIITPLVCLKGLLGSAEN